MGTSNIMKKNEFVETSTFGRFYSNVREKRNSQNVHKSTETLVVGKAATITFPASLFLANPLKMFTNEFVRNCHIWRSVYQYWKNVQKTT